MRGFKNADQILNEVLGLKEDDKDIRVYWKFPLAIYSISAEVPYDGVLSKNKTIVLKDRAARDSYADFTIKLYYK